MARHTACCICRVHLRVLMRRVSTTKHHSYIALAFLNWLPPLCRFIRHGEVEESHHNSGGTGRETATRSHDPL